MIAVVEYNLSTGHRETLAIVSEEEVQAFILIHSTDDKTSDHVIYADARETKGED